MADRPLDIAIVIEHANMRGGQERVASYLARCLSARHRVTVYCYEADQQALGSQVHVVPVRPQPHSKLLGAIAFPWLASRALRRGHDIVLANGGNCLSPNFALFHTCHPLRLETMRLVPAERARALSPRERLNMFVRSHLFVRLERRVLLRCPGRSYAVSARLAQDLCRVHKLKPGYVKVAPNGVDLTVFNPSVRRFRSEVRKSLGIGPDELVALFIGGIWWEKGLHIALRAIAQAQGPWHLLVVGSDDDEASFRAMARELGIDRRVHFAGRTDSPASMYGAADCLVLPSRFEGFPLVSLEAAACGLPILISREAAPGHLVDQETGAILDRNPAAFADALQRLAADRQRLTVMGEEAARRAAEFTWDRQAAILEEAFTEYVRSNR